MVCVRNDQKGKQSVLLLVVCDFYEFCPYNYNVGVNRYWSEACGICSSLRKSNQENSSNPNSSWNTSNIITTTHTL